MGCWNGTCMITQLPIKDNEPIVIIPITKAADVALDHCCYSSTYFKPLPIVLHGRYDDYGCANEITGDTKQFIDIINRLGEYTESDIESYYKKDYGDRDEPLIEKYLRFVERNNCSKINFIMIHKEIYDKLKTYNGFFYSIESTINETYLYNNIDTLLNDTEFKSADRSYFSSFGLRYDGFANIRVAGATKESIKEIMCITSTLGLLRKMWMPQTGAGCQSEIEEPHRIICDFYDEYINSSYYANQEEEEEEEEDN